MHLDTMHVALPGFLVSLAGEKQIFSLPIYSKVKKKSTNTLIFGHEFVRYKVYR